MKFSFRIKAALLNLLVVKDSRSRPWPWTVATYALAPIVVGIAAASRYWLESKYGHLDAAFITYYPAVLLVAIIGGAGPGILTTVLSAAAADYWFMAPGTFFTVESAGQGISMGIFIGMGILLSLLSERIRRSSLVEAVKATQEQELALLDKGNMAALDMDRRIMRWSEGCQKLYGFTAEEAKGQRIDDLLRTRFPIPSGEVRRMVIEKGNWEGELVRRTKSGAELVVTVLKALRRDEDGDPLAILEVSTDQTRQRQADEEIRLIFESAPNALVIVGPDGRIEMVNAQTEKWFGYSRHELMGQPIENLVPERFRGTHPGYRQAFTEKPEARPMGKGRDLFARRKDGSEMPVEIGLSPIQTSHRTVILASIVDLTERKQNEEALRREEARLRSILEALPLAVFLADAKGTVIFTNAAVERIWGISTHVSRDEYGQYKGRWYGTSDPVQPEQWALARTLETGQPFVNDLVEIDTPEGTKVLYNFAIPIRSGGGPLLGAVVVTEDVTQRIHAQEQIRQAKEAAEETAAELARSNRDLEQFAYVSSHDLQEPLRMVTGFMQLLQANYKGRIDDTADKYINFAVDGAKRMQSLINDLLAYSRVGTRGKEPQPADTGKVLERALKNLHTSIAESGAKITHGPMPTVPADPTQLEQVFQNLVGNAIKFRSEQPTEVHVEAVREENFWKFTIADNGIGIEEEFREKVFMIFQRLHTRDRYAGTGIGLAICKKIIDRHGGRIWVESTPGGGSTFCFTLPE